MSDVLLAPGSYCVFEDGPLVKLQVGNSVLPFTWDAAIRISSRLCVYQRDAQEYIGMARTLAEPDPEQIKRIKRTVMREAPVVMEGGYEVYVDGPDTVLEVKNGKLVMEPPMARNVSDWLRASGDRVHEQYFPDMTLQFHVANLSDGNAQEMAAQSRRDATAHY